MVNKSRRSWLIEALGELFAGFLLIYLQAFGWIRWGWTSVVAIIVIFILILVAVQLLGGSSKIDAKKRDQAATPAESTSEPAGQESPHDPR